VAKNSIRLQAASSANDRRRLGIIHIGFIAARGLACFPAEGTIAFLRNGLCWYDAFSAKRNSQSRKPLSR
jgi:hypothetical protein